MIANFFFAIYGNCTFGDIIVMDTTGSYCNDLLGIRRIQLVTLAADSSYRDSTPSSGSDRFAMIDEIPVVASDYVTLPVGRDTFTVNPLGANQDHVDAVLPWAYGKTQDAGVATLKPMARHNGSDGYGQVVSVPASSWYINPSPIYVNPSTNAPFTRAEFNEAEFGYQRDT